KRHALAEFEVVWRELQIRCPGCGRAACPECWDVDNRLCADCVAQRALPRIRHTSGPSVAPLAKGQLQLVERGRYSNAPPRAWLDELLAAQSSIIAARPREGQSPGGPSFQQATVSRADMLAAARVTDLPGSDSLLPPPQLPPATAAAMHAPSPESPGTT